MRTATFLGLASRSRSRRIRAKTITSTRPHNMPARIKSFGLGAILGIILGATVLGAFAGILLIGLVLLGAGAATYRGRRWRLGHGRAEDARPGAISTPPPP